MTTKHIHIDDLKEDQIQQKYPRKTLWYIAYNWLNRELINDIDHKNFKQLLQINYKASCMLFSNNVVVCSERNKETMKPTNEIIIITSQNQYIKKKITNGSDMRRDIAMFILVECLFDSLLTGSNSLLNLISELDPVEYAIAIGNPLDPSTSIEDKISIIKINMEKFKKRIDPDLFKINKFIEDNPDIKNPELLDCPLSQFRKRISHFLRGPVGYPQKIYKSKKRKRYSEKDD